MYDLEAPNEARVESCKPNESAPSHQLENIQDVHKVFTTTCVITKQQQKPWCIMKLISAPDRISNLKVMS